MPCNREDAKFVDSTAFYDHYKIYLDNQTVNDITALGGGTSAIAGSTYAVLVELEYVATLGTPVTAALAAGLAGEIAWLGYANNGCGVVVDLYIVENHSSPYEYLEDIPLHTISSQ